MAKKFPLVILDRDGVINQDSKGYIKHPDEWHPLPGSIEAIVQLCQNGFHVAIATNQSGIARGLYTEEILHAIHEKLHRTVQQQGGKISVIAYCPHHPDIECHCRKPNPGMLEQIAKHFNLASLSGIPFIGDNLKDVEAALAINARPILVKTGSGTKTFEANADFLKDILVFDDLLQASLFLLNEKI